MAASPLTAAILIVSDTAARDPSSDATGDILTDTFQSASSGADKWTIAAKTIVPDSIQNIQRSILQWTDQDDAVNLIVTSGGTGFAVKDVTPEAVTPILHRHAPGLVHGMFSASFAATPFAATARLVAGVRKKTVIVTLPGSPKGARENLRAVIKVLSHACVLAAGAESRSLHSGGVAKLEAEAGIQTHGNKPSSGGHAHVEEQQQQCHKHGHHLHHHHRHHHHHPGHEHGHDHTGPIRHSNPEGFKSSDPDEGPSRRHRVSQYPMKSVDEALELISLHTPASLAVDKMVDSSLVGSVLVTDVTAEEAVPAFRASIVDGYALVVSEESPASKGVFPVMSVLHTAPGDVPELKPGQVARITTGAPLPAGATAVVMVEDTALRDVTSDKEEEKTVEILTNQTKAGENVRDVGSDINLGEKVLHAGEEITAVGGELGLLASIGVSKVRVWHRPQIGVLSSGDEIVDHNTPGPLQPGRVRDCNRPGLMAALQSLGFEVTDLGIVSDKSAELETKLRDALDTCDVVVTTGGASMGELDLMKPTIERRLGGTIHFGRVSMAPGKPTTFATVGVAESTNRTRWIDKAIFSLPGNPASAIVTLHVFVLPYLHGMSGITPTGLPKMLAMLDEDMQPLPQRDLYHRATAYVARDGLVHARSTGGQRSSRVGSLRAANAFLVLKARPEAYKEGTQVGALLLDKMTGLELGR